MVSLKARGLRTSCWELGAAEGMAALGGYRRVSTCWEQTILTAGSSLWEVCFLSGLSPAILMKVGLVNVIMCLCGYLGVYVCVHVSIHMCV